MSGFNAQEARSLRAYYFPPVINKTEIDTACERRPQAPNKPHAVLASMVCAAGAAVSFGTARLASGILAAHLELCSSRGSKCPFCMRSDVGPRQPQRSHRNVTSREQPPQYQQASIWHGYPTCSCLSPSGSIVGLRGWHVQHTQHMNGTRASQQDFPNERQGVQIGSQTLPHPPQHPAQQDFPNEQIGSQIGLQTLPHSVLHIPGSLKQGPHTGPQTLPHSVLHIPGSLKQGPHTGPQTLPHSVLHIPGSLKQGPHTEPHTEPHVVRHVLPHAMNGAHSPTHGGGILHQQPGRTKQNSSTLERPISRPSTYDGLSSFVFQTLPGVPATTDLNEPV